MGRNWTQAEVDARMADIRAGKPAIEAEQPIAVIGKAKRKGGLKPRQPNKTEARFMQHLDLQVKSGLIKQWWFEEFKFRIGDDCWFCPDFLVETTAGGIFIYDTKGTKRNKRGKTIPLAKDDAVVKSRSIADKFPFPVFFVWPEKNGEWGTKRM